MSSITISLALAAVLLMVVVVFLVLLKRQAKKVKSLERALEASQEKFKLLEQSLRQLKEEIYEVREGTLGMGNRLKQVSTELSALQHSHQDLANQEPGSKLYTQAAKLVAAGASIESLMQECELPRAEAELLYNLHKSQS